MTRWTSFQFATIVAIGLFLAGMQLFRTSILSFLTSINIGVQPPIIITFLTIITVIWGCALLVVWQSKKGKPLFKHKIWRIMPAIVGGWLLLSIIGFLVLGLTILSDINTYMLWLVDLFIIYFLALFYIFILSIVIRYGNTQNDMSTITFSANIAVLVAIIILFFLPGL
ncbi:hypothetical protein MHZ92_08490 [Sporosarcina sp. ACRSL]|uniref:hypothetical protein n=1 Tax=Sporosarcina sp. ACRSL TaxID=2918215 RepID=UPI001EF746EE|nr:hypothetical protein [Sporosarcina sp. ACRSL]MCG7344168.1 hypothetical protein [Sporosarcina sp. ACRSL]